MKTINIEQTDLTRCVRDAQSERIVVTRNGRPVAVVLGVEGLDAEQLQSSLRDGLERGATILGLERPSYHQASLREGEPCDSHGGTKAYSKGRRIVVDLAELLRGNISSATLRWLLFAMGQTMPSNSWGVAEAPPPGTRRTATA